MSDLRRTWTISTHIYQLNIKRIKTKTYQEKKTTNLFTKSPLGQPFSCHIPASSVVPIWPFKIFFRVTISPYKMFWVKKTENEIYEVSAQNYFHSATLSYFSSRQSTCLAVNLISALCLFIHSLAFVLRLVPGEILSASSCCKGESELWTSALVCNLVWVGCVLHSCCISVSGLSGDLVPLCLAQKEAFIQISKVSL